MIREQRMKAERESESGRDETEKKAEEKTIDRNYGLFIHSHRRKG